MAHIIKCVPKVLGTLGLAAASCGIQKVIPCSGKKASISVVVRRLAGFFGLLMGMMLGSPAGSRIGILFVPALEVKE